MCLASVYKGPSEEDETLILKNVTKIVVEGDDVILFDIIGMETRIRGVVKEIDLMDSIVKIRSTD